MLRRRLRLGGLNDNDSDNDRPALSAMIEAAVAAAATFEGVLSLRESRRRLSSSVGVLSPPSAAAAATAASIIADKAGRSLSE